MGFANAESIQFYALLARRNLGLDSGICSFWDSIQNPRNWLLTSGSQVRVLHGSFRRTIESIICERPAMAALLVFARICSANLTNDLLTTRVVVDHRSFRLHAQSCVIARLR